MLCITSIDDKMKEIVLDGRFGGQQKPISAPLRNNRIVVETQVRVAVA